MITVTYSTLSSRVVEAIEDAIRLVMRKCAIPGFLLEEKGDVMEQLLKERVRPALSAEQPPENRNCATLLIIVGGICEHMEVSLAANGIKTLQQRFDALLAGK